MQDQRPLTANAGVYKFQQIVEQSILENKTQTPVTQGPLTQRVYSKNFKIRLEAFNQLYTILENQIPQEKYSYETFIKDINPSCMEKALNLYQLWTKKGGLVTQGAIVNLIQFGIINGKGSNKVKATQMILNQFQFHPEIIQNAIQSGLKNKSPPAKIIAGYLSLLNSILKTFGPKKLYHLKNFFGILQKHAIGTNSILKNQCMNIYKQSIMLIGKQLVDSQTTKLKDAQKKQLEQFYNSWDKEVPIPPRGQKQQEKQTKVSKKKIDAYDISQAVDIFKKYNQKWSEKVLKEQKWKQKINLLDQFINAASVPKLANGQYKHINQMCKRLLNDSNFNVLIKAIKIISLLAKGLRKNYSPYVKLFFFQILCKYRDKRSIIQKQVELCLEQFYYCVSIDEVLEHIKAGLNDKTPIMKIQTLTFVEKFITKKKQQKGQLPQKVKDALIQLGSVLEKLFNDGASQVRDYAVSTVGRLKMVLNDGTLDFLDNKMSKNLMAKMLDAKQKKGEEQLKQKKQSKKEQKKQEKKQEKIKVNFQNQEKKEQKMEKKGFTLKKKELEEQVDLGCSPQQSQQILISNGIKQQTLKKLESAQFKDRIEAIISLRQSQLLQDQMQHVIKVLKKQTKEWKQGNLQINRQLISFFQVIQDSKQLNKKCFNLSIGFFIQKLVDIKFEESVLTFIQSVSKNLTPKYVIATILRLGRADKKQKLSGQICQFIVKVIPIFGIESIPIRQIVEFANETYNNGMVGKKLGTQVYKKLYEYMGEQLKTIGDIQIMKNLDGQFKKITVLQQQEKEQQLQNQNDKKQNYSVLAQNLRFDISAQINKYLPKLQQNDWKIRKDALDSIQKALIQNKFRITNSQAVGQLFRILKQRISDANKNLAKPFVIMIGKLFESLKEPKQYWKVIGSSLISILSDKNIQNRQQVIIALNKIAKQIGNEVIINSMIGFLDIQNVQIRTHILGFILKNEESFWKSDYNSYIKQILIWSSDRNKQIRQLSQQLIQKMNAKLGSSNLFSLTKDMKPAFIQNITTLLNKINGNSLQQRKNQKSKSPNQFKRQKSSSKFKNKKQLEQQSKYFKSDYENKDFILEVDNVPEMEMINASKEVLLKNLTGQAYTLITHYNIEEFGRSFSKLINENISNYMNYFLYFVWTRIFGCQNSYVIQSVLSLIYKKIVDYDKYDQITLKILLKITKEIAFWSQVQIYGQALSKLCQILCKKYSSELLLKHLLQMYSAEPRQYYKKQNNLKQIVKTILRKSIINQLSPGSLKILASNEQLAQDELICQSLYSTFNKNILIQLGFKKQEKNNNFKNQLSASLGHSNLLSTSYMSQKNHPQNRKTKSKQKIIEQKTKKWQSNSYQAPPSSSQFFIISKLYPPNFQIIDKQIDRMVQILSKNSQSQSLQIQKYGKYIIQQLYMGATTCFQNRSFYDINRIHDYLAIVQRAAYNSSLVASAGVVSCNLVQVLLKQLLYQDEHKQQISLSLKSKGIQTTAQGLLKLVNSTVLRLLDNSSPNSMMLYLLDLFINQKKIQKHSKYIALIMKCIQRIGKIYVQNIENVNISDFLMKVHEALQDDEQLPAGKIILQVIINISKILKQSIWTYYQCSVANSEFPDNHIAKTIQNLGIPYPEQDDEQTELRFIINKITIEKDIEGIYQLRQYIQNNPDFKVRQYLISEGLPERQIIAIMSKLEKRNSLRRNIYQEKNINAKVEHIREKFEKIRTNTPTLKKNQYSREANQERMRQRINQVKNKFNSNS